MSDVAEILVLKDILREIKQTNNFLYKIWENTDKIINKLKQEDNNGKSNRNDNIRNS